MSRRWLIVRGSGMLGHSLCRSIIDAGIETWGDCKRQQPSHKIKMSSL